MDSGGHNIAGAGGDSTGAKIESITDIQRAIIVSDLHIGSRYLQRDKLENFIAALPDGYALILNGDVVDYYERPGDADITLIELLRNVAESRRVIWIRGNHDPLYTPPQVGTIEFATSCSLGKRLYVVHGHRFYKVRFYHTLFKAVFAAMYRTCLRLGAEPAHVAFYAKRFPLFYNAFRNRVARNAVNFAIANGYAAITCGHVHYAEDSIIDGIRYINTGAWTEQPMHYIRVEGNQVRLIDLNVTA